MGRDDDFRREINERGRTEWLERRYNLPKRRLDLSDMPGPVTDEDMKRIALFPEVREIKLCRTEVTDRGLAELMAHPTLDEVHLSDTAVGDFGMRFLGRLRDLQMLILDGTNVTDEGVKCLAGLPHLFDLDLTRTAVTDAAIDTFKTMPNLHEVGLAGTKVTDSGLRRILDELPELTRVRVGGPNLSLEVLNDLVRGKDTVEWEGDERFEWVEKLGRFAPKW